MLVIVVAVVVWSLIKSMQYNPGGQPWDWFDRLGRNTAAHPVLTWTGSGYATELLASAPRYRYILIGVNIASKGPPVSRPMAEVITVVVLATLYANQCTQHPRRICLDKGKPNRSPKR